MSPVDFPVDSTGGSRLLTALMVLLRSFRLICGCCTWGRLPVWESLPQDRCAEQGPVASHEQSSDQPSRSHSAIESWFCVMANRSSHFGLGSPNSKRKNSAFLSTTFTKPLNSGKRESLPVQMQVTLQCHQVQADVLNRVCQHAARRLSAFCRAVS